MNSKLWKHWSLQNRHSHTLVYHWGKCKLNLALAEEFGSISQNFTSPLFLLPFTRDWTQVLTHTRQGSSTELNPSCLSLDMMIPHQELVLKRYLLTYSLRTLHSQVYSCTPIIPAFWEPDAGKSKVWTYPRQLKDFSKTISQNKRKS